MEGKIILQDANVPAFCTVDTMYFTFDIDEFKEKVNNINFDNDFWYSNLDYKIKSGKIEIFEEKIFTLNNKEISILNSWNYETIYKIKEAIFTVKSIKFENKYYLLGSFTINGIASLNFEDKWKNIKVYGNPIYSINNKTKGCYDNFLMFSENSIESISEKVLKVADRKILCPPELSQSLMQMILCDLPGEAG
jgi:hypothetical protein